MMVYLKFTVSVQVVQLEDLYQRLDYVLNHGQL
ncbi:unnamed protein product [Schistosoma margrebowiei]|uniref:Uncharacterized protein n=1 Tax=Schistosoma margrebowiei TaxID=48269 RepID=A0A183ND00_9TREM|nr:unnamed protein product [Schistosoma margrebowiei]